MQLIFIVLFFSIELFELAELRSQQRISLCAKTLKVLSKAGPWWDSLEDFRHLQNGRIQSLLLLASRRDMQLTVDDDK